MDRDEFDQLAREWQDGTNNHRFPAKVVLGHVAYRSIVDAGTDVVPWCLEALAKRRSMAWCRLLGEITGQNPGPEPCRPSHVPGCQIHDVQANVKAWLAWGEANGLYEPPPPPEPVKEPGSVLGPFVIPVAIAVLVVLAVLSFVREFFESNDKNH